MKREHRLFGLVAALAMLAQIALVAPIAAQDATPAEGAAVSQVAVVTPGSRRSAATTRIGSSISTVCATPERRFENSRNPDHDRDDSSDPRNPVPRLSRLVSCRRICKVRYAG